MALSPLGLVPLAFVLAVGAGVLLTYVDESWNRTVTRHARRIFGRYVEPSPSRTRLLESAYIGETYRSYAARTLLYTAVAGLVGSILGAYLFGGILLIIPALVDLLMGLPPTMVRTLGLRGFELVLSETQTLAVVTVGGALGGIVGAGSTYGARWTFPRSDAEMRRRQIDEGMARTVAFMYALSRGGVDFPTVMETLADNHEIYGEGAREVGVAVREMELFGRDMITALRQVSQRTPSETFKTFSENLASVLQSGQSLPTFLHDQYDRYQEDASDRQEEVLELLATIAEGYVTLLVAGILFLITILLVFGLTVGDTLGVLQLIAYVVIPLANGAFMLYLGQKLDALGIASNETTSVLDDRETMTFGKPTADGPGTSRTVTDGGLAALAERRRQLRFNDRVRTFRRVLHSPLQTLRWYPSRILYVTVPLALLYVAIRAPAAFATEAVNVHLLDDVLIQALLFVLGTFAVVRELYTRRVRRIEEATPELLERLASLNEAGMSITESLQRVRGSDVGVLTPEIERIWADVTMGANVDDAFVRFGRRVRTTVITRVVTLLTNAMRASGQLGPVLRIAADQARADHRLRRQRRQQMLTYLVVIYISFLVFLVIITSVQEVLVPSLPSEVPTPDAGGRLGVNANQFARLGAVDKAAYTLVFFHTAIVQAILSGFVGGQLGEGSLRDGAKHAAILLGVAYIAFVLLSSPVASLTVEDPEAGDRAIVVESVSVSEGGFVAVYAEDRNGTLLGHSEYLQPGTHSNVEVELSRNLGNRTTVVAVPYRDTDGDRHLSIDGSGDDPYPGSARGEVVSIAIEVD